MARLTISPQAELDVAEIVNMIAKEAGPDAARRYRESLDNLFERFAVFPGSGASRTRLGPRIRIGVVSPYVAVYEFEADHVVDLRVLDGRRRITRRIIRQ